MILITGATGNIGVEALRLTAEKRTNVRAMVRDMSKVPNDLKKDNVQFVIGDFDDSISLKNAMKDIDVVLLISPAIPEQEIRAIDIAKQQGVKHIIKITNHKATDDSPVERRRGHGKVEQHLKNSGLNYTLLAPNFFMQNLFVFSSSIKENNEFEMSAGDGKIGMIDARNVAAVASTIALSPAEHINTTYLLTGPRLITYEDIAKEMTEVFGETITYKRVSTEQQQKDMIEAGVSQTVAESNAQVFKLIAEDDGAWLSDSVKEITGYSPRDVKEFLADYRSVFQK